MTVEILLPAVIVAAALLVLPVLVSRRQWPVAVGFAAAGVGVAVQSPPVYALVDRLLGRQNLTNLAYHVLSLIGIAAFLLVVLTADPRRDGRAATRVVTVSTGAACLLQVILFMVGRATAGWGSQDGHLTGRLSTPLFLAYASLLWVALAALAVTTIVTVRAQTRGRPWSVGKAGTFLVVGGSVAALAWCGNAVVRAVEAVALMRDPAAADPAGQVLALLAGVGVFAGLAVINVPHLAAWSRRVRLQVGTRQLWQRAVRAAPEVTLGSTGRGWPAGPATLYRRWVEIEDALRLGRVQLTDAERSRVARLEALFAPAAGPTGDRSSSEAAW